MGMFDVDKEIGADVLDTYGLRTPFIVWGAKVREEPVKTEIGDARKTVFVTSPLDKPNEKQEVTTLASAIADKAVNADDSDFPSVCELRKVKSNYGGDALVLQWLRDYAEGRAAKTRRNAAADDEIPF